MPQLRFVDDTGTLRSLTLADQPVLIGRVNSCSVVFVDDMISREHSRIDRDRDGRYRIRDLGSRNKTHVNGQQTSETLLNAGDLIRVGEHVIEFVDLDVVMERVGEEVLTPDTQEPNDCEWIRMKTPLALTLAQIENLATLTTHWGLTTRAEDIASHCLGHLVLDLQAERGFIAVRGEEKHTLRPVAHRGLARSPGGTLTPVSQSFALGPMLQKVAGRYPRSVRQGDADSGYAGAAIAVPLSFHGAPIGVVYLDRPTSFKPFAPADLQYLLAAGAAVGAAMAAASRKLATHIAVEEVAWTSSVKRTHAALSTAPVSSESFDVGYRLFPGNVQRGDFVDVFALDDQRLIALLVDAGGQGQLGLAQGMAIRGVFLHAAKVHGDDVALDAAFNALNGLLAGSPGRQLVACTALLCDLAAGRLTYVNAGCPPPVVLVGPSRLLTLDQPSLLLGIDEQYLYEHTAVELPVGFRIVAYTDGLSDAVNASGETFSDRRVHELLLEQEAFGPVDTVLKLLTAGFETHMGGQSARDDVSLLVIGRA